MVKIAQKLLHKERCKEMNSLSQFMKYNPFKILSDYIEARPDARTDCKQFFVFLDNSPVKPENMRTTLKLLIQRCGIQPELYSSHSLRIGRCSDLMDLGLSVETIKKLGRWKSNTVFTYLRN